MEAIIKLNEARKKIKDYNLKKVGYNDYSKYYYYTPEQINKLVNDACNELNLFNKYDLLRTDNGLMAKLRVIDIDTSKYIEFEIATDIPEIKATNIAQQLGGAVTYSERYLLMIAYDIKDNNLDFDAQKPSTPTNNVKNDEKPWMSERDFNRSISAFETGNFGEFETATQALKSLLDKFKMKKAYKEQLEELAKFTDNLNK